MTMAWQREVGKALALLAPACASTGSATAVRERAKEAHAILAELVDPRVEVVAQRLNGSSNPSADDRLEASKLLEYADAVDRREVISQASARRIAERALAPFAAGEVGAACNVDQWRDFLEDLGIEVRRAAS